MAKRIFCRRCGAHIKTISSDETYSDAYLPAFSQLCDSCHGEVSRNFDRRTEKLRKEMSDQGYDSDQQYSVLNQLREEASSRTFVDRTECQACDGCGEEGNLTRTGYRKLCSSCLRSARDENERLERSEREVARARGRTNVDDL